MHVRVCAVVHNALLCAESGGFRPVLRAGMIVLLDWYHQYVRYNEDIFLYQIAPYLVPITYSLSSLLARVHSGYDVCAGLGPQVLSISLFFCFFFTCTCTF